MFVRLYEIILSFQYFYHFDCMLISLINMIMIFIPAGVISERCTYPENIKDRNDENTVK